MIFTLNLQKAIWCLLIPRMFEVSVFHQAYLLFRHKCYSFKGRLLHDSINRKRDDTNLTCPLEDIDWGCIPVLGELASNLASLSRTFLDSWLYHGAKACYGTSDRCIDTMFPTGPWFHLQTVHHHLMIA
ncbi:hypothetical protein NE237_017349 [Protea cynaroides]|uniref:Uncharacterized protein n=1 Tax=Protea cynaroides TaxID=273540 RepID=A0A9Q0QMT3_9MAGN|nr:hypothetical protein NE237_017349 [Protea cynaroides]